MLLTYLLVDRYFKYYLATVTHVVIVTIKCRICLYLKSWEFLRAFRGIYWQLEVNMWQFFVLSENLFTLVFIIKLFSVFKPGNIAKLFN